MSAATQGSEDGGEAHPAASSGSDEEAHPQGSAESAEANDQTGRSKFDRLVSQVFASTERGEKDGALHASESSASRADGPGRLGSAARRWQAKLSGSYLRRAVSARFGARTAAISGDGGADEQGGKQGQAAGKSGE